MSLSKTLYPLIIAGSFQKDRKIVDWDVKHKHKQSYQISMCVTFTHCSSEHTYYENKHYEH